MVKFTVHYAFGQDVEQWIVWTSDKNDARSKFYAEFGDDTLIVKIV